MPCPPFEQVTNQVSRSLATDPCRRNARMGPPRHRFRLARSIARAMSAAIWPWLARKELASAAVTLTTTVIGRCSRADFSSRTTRSGGTTSSPRRVLLVADCVGGVWQYSLELAAGLGPHGVEVVLAVVGPPPTPAQRAEAEAVPGPQIR